VFDDGADRGGGVVGGHEHEPVLQGRLRVRVDVPVGARVPEHEHHLPPHPVQPRPADLPHGLLQGGRIPPYVVGGEDAAPTEERTQNVLQLVVPGQDRPGPAGLQVARLGLQEHEDRKMTGMATGPDANLEQAARQGRAGRVIVEVGHVMDQKLAGAGVVVDVQLELAHAAKGKLGLQRLVGVIPGGKPANHPFAGLSVVAVVGAHDLNVVHAKGGVGGRGGTKNPARPDGDEKAQGQRSDHAAAQPRLHHGNDPRCPDRSRRNPRRPGGSGTASEYRSTP